jgi:WD40 repeat protein
MLKSRIKVLWPTLLVVLTLLSMHALRAAEPPTDPILRIETGMHTATIKHIDVDGANRYLVTASEDKTARVWDLREGRLLQTLRPPIGAGNEGKLFAVAISPDGGTIACGGWTTNENGNVESIYLFERASGRLMRRIAGLPNVIFHLAFAPDGRSLAATLFGNNGVRVFRVVDGTLVGEDRDYGGDSYGASWSRDGRLATTCWDGQVRLYEAGLRLVAKAKAPGGAQPYGIAFSPDGTRLAVGFGDSTRVDVLSATNLAPLYAPNTRGVDNGDLSTVTWSEDGRWMFAGGGFRKSGLQVIRRWEDGGRGAAQDLPAAQNTIMDLKPLRGGGVVWGAADPAWGMLEANGTRSTGQSPTIADYRDNRSGFRLDEEGSRLTYGYDYGGKLPAEFAIPARALQTVNESQAFPTLHAPLTEAPGLAVTEWKDTYTPKLNGRTLPLQQYETSRSLALAPDNSGFLLGTEWYLRYFNRDGVEKWQVPTPGTAWAVNVARNGRVGAAAFDDGTIRWYRLSDGVELLAFFPHADRKRWVLWTPTGYYDASPGGEELIGWHINNGKDSAADFFPASRFRNQFYRPDIVSKVLSTLDEAQAVQQANAEANRKTQTVETKIENVLPPVVRTVSPQDGAVATTPSLRVQYAVRTPADAPVTQVRALVDGRPVETKRDLQLAVAQRNEQNGEIVVAIPPHDCEISIIAENKNAASEAATVRIKWQGAVAATTEFSVKPKLYVLAIGVSQYANPEFNLNYAAKDARDFTAACVAQKGGLYREVETKVLCDVEATRDNIVDGLEWIQSQTTAKDVAMVFLSGHGVNAPPNNDYYFVPHNFNRDRIRATGVVFSEIQQTVQNIAGKALFFVDSCHSGNVMGAGKSKGVADINAVINELSSAENGTVVFSASTGRQVALEHPDWKNGAFTKAIVEGMSGKAEFQGGRVTVKSLDFYISERVKALTGGKQTPTTAIPPTVPDFPMAMRR